MYVSADQMPPESRIWIYQSNRPFSEKEESDIELKAKAFLNNWTSHNVALKASFSILYHSFLIVMVDENFASTGGCSIDKSLHFIQQVEKDYSLSLLDRNVFAYKEDGSVKLVKRAVFEKLLNENVIDEETIVFNNLIQTKRQLETDWEIPLKESWHKTIL